MKQQTSLQKKGLRTSCQPSLPRALHTTIHNIKSNMNQVFLDNVKATNSNKKWVDIDIKGRSLHILERKEVLTKFRIFSEYDYLLAHHLKKMNLIDSDICIFCNQNSIRNSELCSSAVHSIEKYIKQKISPASFGKQEVKLCKIQNPNH